jgi:hypothetical protein
MAAVRILILPSSAPRAFGQIGRTVRARLRLIPASGPGYPNPFQIAVPARHIVKFQDGASTFRAQFHMCTDAFLACNPTVLAAL